MSLIITQRLYKLNLFAHCHELIVKIGFEVIELTIAWSFVWLQYLLTVFYCME